MKRFLLLLAFPTWYLPGLLQAAEPPPRPNILFAIADDWSPHAGAYGTRWVRTPHFDRVAKEGLLFMHAYTPNAKCAPSRACILTGRNSWQLKEAANHICYFPPEFKGWGEVLSEHGWFVGHTTKGWGPGVAQDADGKPRTMTGRAFNERKATPPTSGVGPADYAANFRDFLDAAPADRPWCFWYGAIEPHRGYEFGAGITKGGKRLDQIDRVPGYWPDHETVRTDMLDYALEVEHFDTHLGRMLAELDRRGQLANTLVVVTSDHGMPFPRVKGNAYSFANHVPLAVRWPEGIRKPGRVVRDFVSFVDFAPTFLELADIEWSASGMAPAAGRSLLPLLRDLTEERAAPRDHVLIGKERTDVGRPHDWGYPTRGIVTDRWLYLRHYEPARWPANNPETGYTDCDAGATKSLILDAHRKDPADRHWALCFGLRAGEELYDLSADPDCLRNLAKDPAAAATARDLAARLTAQLTAQGDPRMSGQGEVFDHYRHANKGHVGFHAKFTAGKLPVAGWIKASDIDPPTTSP
jgi:arylsulfatase A-like enzyme